MTVDARYIAQSDNTAVTTWANRGSSTYDMTQATAAAKPTFRDGTNGLNGLPTLSFDGGDLLEGINTSLSTFSIVAVANRSASGANAETIFSRGTTSAGTATRDIILYYLPNSGTVELQRSNGTNFPTITASASSGAHVVYARYDGSNLGVRVDNGTEGTTAGVSSTANAPWAIGATREQGPTTILYYFKSKISLIAVWNGTVLSDSLRKRATHAAAYSFKVPCS